MNRLVDIGGVGSGGSELELQWFYGLSTVWLHDPCVLEECTLTQIIP